MERGCGRDMDSKNPVRVTSAATRSAIAEKKINEPLRMTMKNEQKREICTALTDGAILLVEQDGRVMPRFTQESDYVLNVFDITNLAERIVHTQKDLFSLETNKYTQGKLIQPNKIGRFLMNALKTDVPGIRNAFPTHEFNPYFEMFVRHARERDLDYWLTIRNAYSKEEITRSYDTLQGFVNALRHEGQSASFKAKVRSFQRNPNKNCRSLNRYLRKTLVLHSKINIARFDLSYRRDASSLITSPSTMTSETVKAHREAFLKSLKKSEVSEHLIGNAWKMEGSVVKGFLHHVLLVLNEESISNQSVNKVLQNNWSQVTEGNGLLVNCSTLTPSCKSEGTGLLEHSSRDAWAIIRKICVHLTQTDNYIKLKLPNGGRVFGRAEVANKSKNSGTAKPQSA